MKTFSYTFTFLLFIYSFSFAQNGSVSGKVSAKGEPLFGATLFLAETYQGTVTDKSGAFRLNDIANGNYTLKVSYLGAQTREIPVTIQSQDHQLDDIELTEDFLQLEQIVITATRNPILRKDAPIVCNVLDDKILTATQSVTLAEGLSFQPALRIENNCQNCGFNGLRMNGLEGAYSQILIDGRPIYNSLQGVYGLEQIPANMIERVEVVRSGGSALYGSSAIAGTVNVITKEPRKNGAYFSTNQSFIGNQAPDRTYMLGTDIVNEDLSAGVSLNGFNRNRTQWDSNGDGISEIGQLEATSFSVKAFYNPTKLSRITFNGYNIFEFRRGGNKFDMPFHETDITESTTHNILNGGLTFEQFTKSEQHKFSIYANAQKLKRDSYYGAGEDANAYGNSTDNSLVTGIQYTGELGEFAGGSHTLVSGMEYNLNHLQDNAPSYDRFIDQTAAQLGFYLQDMWEIGRKFNVLLGGRIDRHNLVEKAVVSPRGNILYKISPEWQFRTGYARGFRAPQVFDEDLHITQVGGEGTVVRNAMDLNPEYSDAFSTSLDYNKYFTNGSVGITLDAFHTRLTDVFVLEEIGNDSSGDLLLERRNGSGARVSGLTIHPKASYKDKLNMQFGITFQKSLYDEPVQWSETIENRNRRFFRTPDAYGFYVFTYAATKQVTLNFSGVYTGAMVAQHYAGYIAEDVLEFTPSFLENNFKIDYNFDLKGSVKCVLSGGVQNFTNAYQRDFDLGPERDSAYIYGPARPRTYFLGMRIML